MLGVSISGAANAHHKLIFLHHGMKISTAENKWRKRIQATQRHNSEKVMKS